jgi:catechol 2,3-dioxygenase-like lactoylglutathione lyase family enzyme
MVTGVFGSAEYEFRSRGERMASSIKVSHVAMAVADLPASLRFYTDGLGFEPGPCFESGDEVAGVSEVSPPVRMISQFVTKDGVRLELMGWESPVVHGSPSKFRNQRGLTHLSFEVDDLEEVEARLVALGGSSIPDARIRIDKGSSAISLIFVADPDGARIELMQRHPAGS